MNNFKLGVNTIDVSVMIGLYVVMVIASLKVGFAMVKMIVWIGVMKKSVKRRILPKLLFLMNARVMISGMLNVNLALNICFIAITLLDVLMDFVCLMTGNVMV